MHNKLILFASFVKAMEVKRVKIVNLKYVTNTQPIWAALTKVKSLLYTWGRETRKSVRVILTKNGNILLDYNIGVCVKDQQITRKRNKHSRLV